MKTDIVTEQCSEYCVWVLDLQRKRKINFVWSRQEDLHYGSFIRIFYFDQQRSRHSRYLNSERFRTNYQQSSFQFYICSVINVKFFE